MPLVGRVEADARDAAQLVARQMLLPGQAAVLANARRRGDPRTAQLSRGRARQADFCAAPKAQHAPCNETVKAEQRARILSFRMFRRTGGPAAVATAI